ncbi:MAG: hypothetical protein KDA79_25260, partial [Planctomycetaceae bacterium]|nr:hypothetical protein [Planctomycetaceae bacterium]
PPDKLTGRRQNVEAGAGTAQTTVLSRSLFLAADAAGNGTVPREVVQMQSAEEILVLSAAPAALKGKAPQRHSVQLRGRMRLSSRA